MKEKKRSEAAQEIHEIAAMEETAIADDMDTYIPEAPKFSIDTLKSAARELFGVSESTFVAATHHMTGEFTTMEMKNEIEKWLKEVN